MAISPYEVLVLQSSDIAADLKKVAEVEKIIDAFLKEKTGSLRYMEGVDFPVYSIHFNIELSEIQTYLLVNMYIKAGWTKVEVLDRLHQTTPSKSIELYI